jgi:hypothetical protein
LWLLVVGVALVALLPQAAAVQAVQAVLGLEMLLL